MLNKTSTEIPLSLFCTGLFWSVVDRPSETSLEKTDFLFASMNSRALNYTILWVQLTYSYRSKTWEADAGE